MSQQLTLGQTFASEIKTIPNHLTIAQDNKKNNQYINKKRYNKQKHLSNLEKNYLIRRFYANNIQNEPNGINGINEINEYEITAKIFSILNHFDFDLPPYNKFSSIKNFSANAFWFLICSNYFPFLSNQLIDKKIYLHEELKKLIDHHINTSNISINKKNQNLGEKFNFLKNLKNIVNKFSKKKNNSNEKNNLFQTISISPSLKLNNANNSNSISLNENKANINLSNLSCSNNISSIKALIENLIKYFEHQNEVNIPSKIKNDFLLKEKYQPENKVEEDLELDIKYHTNIFEKFREEILNKVEPSDEDENDDVVCHVCGDGEYEDDNLILYCSKCNITVHQKCYGVLVIPEEDWICHLCRSFNDVNICNNMECILCPNLGGAMKPCTLRKSSHSYKVMIKNRKNPFLRDNINKNYNLNNNLINSISEENKDNKNVDNKINNNIKNEGNCNKIQENALITNSENNQNNNMINIIPPNVNSIMKIINVNSNSNDNLNVNNNNIQTNSANNTNNNNDNINQNNPLEASSRSFNINKDIDSIMSNSSSIKINTKEENENNNSNTNKNPINKSLNKNLKKQGQKAKSQNDIYLSEKIANENAWVHLSCALWHPEISLANFELKEKIKGVETLPKKKLMEQCNICLKSGPTIPCQKCSYRFHPECARRLKNFFLEISENESCESTYLAYCNKDAPPRHLKKYELIRQRKRDDIKKFAEALRKDITSLNKLCENKQNNSYNFYCPNIEEKKKNNEEKKMLKKIGKNCSNDNGNDSNKKIITTSYNFEKATELTNSEKKSLLNAIRETAIDESNLTLEINAEDYSLKTNNNIRLTYEDLQYPEKFCWLYLKKNQYYLEGLSNYETFKIFQMLVPNKIDYARNILKEKIISPEKMKKTKNKGKEKQKQIARAVSANPYCICTKILDNNWVGCDNDNGKCPGKNWYHIECIPELKNYTMKTFENYFEKYYCPKCRELFKYENVLKKGDEVNEINVSLHNEENGNSRYINISNISPINNDKNNMELELKKQESNVVECVNIDNNEGKSEGNQNKDNKDNLSNINSNNNGECPMEVEGKTKEENKEKKILK